MWYKHIYICVCVDIYMKGKFTRPSYCFKGDQHTHTRWWWRMLREWSTEPLSHIVSLILDFSRFFRFPSVFFICICISPSFHLHVSCRSFELTKKKKTMNIFLLFFSWYIEGSCCYTTAWYLFFPRVTEAAITFELVHLNQICF